MNWDAFWMATLLGSWGTVIVLYFYWRSIQLARMLGVPSYAVTIPVLWGVVLISSTLYGWLS